MSPFSEDSSGRITQVKPRKGSVRIRAARSGLVSAHDLGAISPTTMCRNVTSASEIVSAIGSRSDSDTPTAAKTGSR